jgi:acyl-homoserine lactone acylase PvdQ
VRLLGGSGALVAVLALALTGPAAEAQVQGYGQNDYGGFRNILPPGENGLVDATQLAAFEATKQRPPHNDDQLAMYAKLTTAAPNIRPAQLSQYYKDATFGVPAGGAESTESPEPGVTIVRDSQFGVPHIYGDTRAATMFGIGYATAEDRLFFIDALRHAGQADLAQFVGGANVSMDESVWAGEPYTQQDLANQIQYGLSHSQYGSQIYQDAQSFINGINAYIARARDPLNLLTMMPAEYTVLGLTPQPFTLPDLVSIGTLVGGIFGNGGGIQLDNAILYEDVKSRLGRERYSVLGSPEVVRHAPRARRADHSGFGTFLSFVDPNDPEAPTTVRGKKFPYQALPAPRKASRAVALPDQGSVQFVNPVVGGAVPHAVGRAAPTSAGHRIADALGPLANAGPGLLAFPRGMSNALLVSGAHTSTGHPIAVMGPQVAYFSPEILMEEDIHGPGIDARGAAFPGVNLYVQLGHGQDYAWSATSSGQNIIDTFAVPLCSPTGGAVRIDSDFYVLHGRCAQMQTLTRSESWAPNLADSTPAGSITLQTKRTAFGLVIARARIDGRPVAYTNLRSTYMHELDSVVGLYLFNTPSAMRNPRDFMNAAYQIQYTFNWFYADDKHIAYFDSGLNPQRAAGTNPLFPSWSRYAWRGYNGGAALTPAGLTERQTTESSHPQVVDQSYLTSWNNKQAPAYNDTATAQQYTSVYRSQLLDNNVNAYLAHGKLTLADLVNAMGNAGTQDLRGVAVLPYALRILGHPSEPTLAGVVSELRTWVQTGAHRINRQHPGASGTYDQSAAVRIMDAWWPLLIRAEFQPVLGASLLDEIESHFTINDQPGGVHNGSTHVGSAWDVGFYGIVQKDLRSVLGLRVRGPLNRIYCGYGSLASCRPALLASLQQAISESPRQVYPADGACAAGDQMCSDSIQFRAIGAITQPLMEWVNRPTFQQAVQVLGHGPR